MRIDKEIEQLLEKIERSHNYVDHLDAFRIVSLYTEKYGVIYTALPIEEELELMLHRLKGKVVFEEDFTDQKLKTCLICNRTFTLTHFNKNWSKQDGHAARCRFCESKKPDAYERWLEKQDIKKTCPDCKREYAITEFSINRKECKRCKNKAKENEPKSTD